MSDVAGVPGASTPYRSLAVVEPKAAQPSVIECESLVHAFDSKAVLRGVTFRVPRGRLRLHRAERGGKTTTLRILATLLEPTAGTARIAGHDVTAIPSASGASSATCRTARVSTSA